MTRNMNTKTDFSKMLKNKRVLIWSLGLHGGGIGAAKFFAQNNAKVLVTDLKDAKALKRSILKLKKYKNIIYHLGEHKKDDFKNNDYIVINPAVKPTSAFYKLAKKNKQKLITDMGFLMENTPAFIIGITGTKGKSTTTKLIFDLVQREIKNKKHPFFKKYNKVYLGGNIRVSPFDFINKLDEKSIVVLEMSSFQLYHTKYAKISPNIAIITNLIPEHLDWHGTFDEYQKAKCLISNYQKKNDILIINKNLKKLTAKVKSKVFYTNGENHDNLFQFAKALNINKDDVELTIKNFKGLAGRQELVDKINDRKFINDTCATHPAANLYMLRSFENPIVIWGGVDKGFDIKTLAKEFMRRNIRLFIFKGSAGEKILKVLKKDYVKKHVTSNIQTMDDAVEMAYKISKKEDVIILSPGAASFNMFLNEFDRGKKFIKAVKSLKNNWL